MNMQQQQQQQQQQQLANGERAAENSNGNANQNIPSAEENGAKKVESPVVTKPLKKNFASMDCGAKVLSANSEAQSPGNVISPHKDEYLLNKARKRSHSQEQFLFCFEYTSIFFYFSADTGRGSSSSCARTSRR